MGSIPISHPLEGLFYLNLTMSVLIRWFIASLAIIISAYLLPGVHVKNFLAALAAALVLGLLNLIVKPILVLFTLPINILTLGLFTLVINAAIIKLATLVVPGFTVDTWGWAILFGVVLALINMLFGKK